MYRTKMASRESTSHGRVIVDCELSLKKYMSLEKVVPAMVERKILSRKEGKIHLKKNDMGLFIDSVLKKLSLERFGVFLTVVRAIEEDSTSETKERPLMKILSSQLKKMKLKADQTNVQKIFSEFIKAADEEFKMSSQLPSASTSSTTIVDELSTNALQSATALSSLPSATTANGSSVVSGSETVVTKKPSDTGSRSVNHPEAPELQAAVALEGRRPFPRGYLSDCKSRRFTREGGMLYSPEHGVTVIISEAAVPASIENFMLGLYVYMKGPFSLPEDTQLCSPIVWFHHHPRFRFEADVTIKLPHSAVIAVQQPQCCSLTESPTNTEDDYPLHVITMEEGMAEGATQYALTRHLPADFSDGYHAVFAVRHFSPHAVVKCQNKHQLPERKRLGSNESSGVVRKRTHSNSSTASRLPSKGQTTMKDLQKSGSLEDELYQVKQGESRKGGSINIQGEIKFCIARCMPTDRSTGNWDVNFLISHWHPTGIQAMLRYAEKLLEGKSVDVVKRPFYFTEEDIEFLPEFWTSSTNCWKVEATETNVLSKDDVLMELTSPSTQLGDQCETFYPPRLDYSVQAQIFPPTEQLDRTIEVRGAAEANRGKALFFKLRSKMVRNGMRRSRQLCTAPYLYSHTAAGTAPNILQAISQHDGSLPFNLSDPNHIKFLIDISLQLTGQDHPEKLGQVLHLDHSQIERIQGEKPDDISWQVYSILIEWLSANAGSSSETTLGTLKDALSKIEVTDIKISELSDTSDRGISLSSTNLDMIPIADPPVPGKGFLLNLSEKLQCCWRKIGSLMGIPKSVLDACAEENDQLHEQAYQISLTWQKRTMYEATTHGVVFKAVQRLHEHHPSIVNDAWLYCVHYSEQNSA